MTSQEFRRLTMLAKQLIADLRESNLQQESVAKDLSTLVRLLNPRQEQNHAIREDGNANQGPDSQEPFFTIRSETQFPRELVEEHRTNQRDDGRWKRKSFWLGSFTLLFVVVNAAILWKQWGSMRDTVDIGRAAQRPWIGISQSIVDSVSYTPSGDGVNLISHITLKNFGTSPAFRVLPMLMLAPDWTGIDAAARNSCIVAKQWFDLTDADIKRAAENREQGSTIFPGQDITKSFASGIGLRPNPPNLDTLWLVGCVFYRDNQGKTRRTQFCLATGGTPRQGGGGAFLTCSTYNNAD